MDDNNTVGTYVDESLVDHVLRNRRLHNDNDNTVEEQELREELPEELMSQLEPFLGDGNAKLTVSGALSSSQSFHKAEAFVSVTVTCNNDLDDVRKVHDVVRPFLSELVVEDHHTMSLLRDDLLPEDKKIHLNDEKGPAIAAGVKVATPPQRSASIKVTPGAPAKPNFRR